MPRPDAQGTASRPCLLPWDGCPQSSGEDHSCGRKLGHGGPCRCSWCGTCTTVIDPIFEDPEELEMAQEACDEW